MGLLDEMRVLFNLRFSHVAGGRLFFAHIPTGQVWVYFKSWDDVRESIQTRKETLKKFEEKAKRKRRIKA